MAIVVRKLGLVHSSATVSRSAGDARRLRVAIASQDGKNLDAHFGYAKKLMVYDVTRRTHRLVQAFSFVADDQGAQEADTIGPKIVALAGCHLLFVLAIGPPAAAKVLEANIHPMKISAPESVEAVIDRVQMMIEGPHPRWLRDLVTKH